jgi:D-sedoheptulose 7-phosphate isomerase
VRAHGRAGDVLLAISTSGSSHNVLRAVDEAHEVGMKVIGLTGGSGGALARSCDVCLTVPAASTPRIQEMHILLAHVLCGLVEDALS